MIRSNRSMNNDLSVGMVEGKVAFLRPHAVDADESHAAARAQVLHPQHYGTMGISASNTAVIRANRPDSTPPYLGG